MDLITFVHVALSVNDQTDRLALREKSLGIDNNYEMTWLDYSDGLLSGKCWSKTAYFKSMNWLYVPCLYLRVCVRVFVHACIYARIHSLLGVPSRMVKKPLSWPTTEQTFLHCRFQGLDTACQFISFWQQATRSHYIREMKIIYEDEHQVIC